jgi:RND superfamily putative drug exporter
MSRRNIAARAGRWSAAHPWKAIAGWVVLVLVATAVGAAAGTRTLEEDGVGESGRAERTLDRAFPEAAEEAILVQSRTRRVDDPEFAAVVREVAGRVARLPGVSEVRTPYGRDGAAQVSADRRSAVVALELDARDAEERVGAVLAAVDAAKRAHPGFRIGEYGDASVARAASATEEADFARAEKLSIPLTLAILVLAFGAFAAAFLALGFALSAVVAAIGLIGPLSQVWPVDEGIGSVVLLIGLAVGVDYSMFYIRREREERARGLGPAGALEVAAATSGRAVLVSGMTVMVAMAGMYVAGAATFVSFATGTILVVGVAVAGSVTVLPALLAKLGDRVDRGRLPFLDRLKVDRGEGSRTLARLVALVMRRPLAAGLAATAVLVALAVPALGMRTALPEDEDLPRGLEVMQVYERLETAFPGGPHPHVVVVEARDVRAPRVAAAIAELRRRATGEGDMREPVETSVSADGTVASVSLPAPGSGTDARSRASLRDLRERLVPEVFGGVPGVRVDVAGLTAGTGDFNDLMAERVPWVFAFVLTLAFVLLLVTFRSIVVPIKAIVLNLLSVGAAYGLLVLVFQHGLGQDLLGVERTGPIASWLPLFLFVILFGLSMDYHVFILSRVREAVDRGMSTEAAVAHAIRATAGVVTSAAVVMIAVFGVFATLRSIQFKQMGVGLGAAILIDATIVRVVLLPAAMKLLGEHNWYLPRSLRWLPRLGGREAPAAARA